MKIDKDVVIPRTLIAAIIAVLVIAPNVQIEIYSTTKIDVFSELR